MGWTSRVLWIILWALSTVFMGVAVTPLAIVFLHLNVLQAWLLTIVGALCIVGRSTCSSSSSDSDGEVLGLSVFRLARSGEVQGTFVGFP